MTTFDADYLRNELCTFREAMQDRRTMEDPERRERAVNALCWVYLNTEGLDDFLTDAVSASLLEFETRAAMVDARR